MAEEPRNIDTIDDAEDYDGDDEELTRDDLARLRQRLLEERAGVVQRLQRHLNEVVEDTDNLPDEMDIASRQTDQAYLLRMADKEKKLLGMIDHALAKFDRGTYGICEGTGEPIGRKRLEMRPWARHSVEYKEQLERERGGVAKNRG
jgi:DnaK suppressor protein